ncbi:MAG: hypothetical protein EON54_22785 [Alcaligenaceae bacterium]|nr:MAG: hypothetical protein EON54_22785 [Alcaligenaceae bacterium]
MKNRFLLYAAIAATAVTSWLSMTHDKRLADVKAACSQALEKLAVRGTAQQTPAATANASSNQLVQVNEERQTCQPPRPEE